MSKEEHVIFRLERIAKRYGSSVAMTFRGPTGYAHWTYGEFVGRAADIAAALATAGVRQGQFVGIRAHRLPETIAGMIAVLSLGACYVPVDPHQPPQRTLALFETAGATLVIDARKGGTVAVTDAAGSSETLVERSVVGSHDLFRGLFGSSDRSGEDPAYVMFTSGSTGQPKGVVVPHRAICRLVTDQHYLRFDDSRVFLQAAPMGFDASTLEIYGPLLHGGRCVLYPSGALPTATGLREEIAANGITTAWLTAAVFHAIVDHDVQCLNRLEELIVGGEALSIGHVRKALAALPNTQLVNGYGPTENTTFSACHRIPAELPESALRVPIGRAIAGTSLLVVDETLRPVAPGTEGELLAVGKGLALGYLGDPERTRERFVDIHDAHGNVLLAYRTGDRVIELPDGSFDFLGRRDEQVKIHGYRIEPAEVEATIAGCPEVRQCRVVVRRNAAGQARLTACLVLWQVGGLEKLRARLPDVLPPYMIPHELLALPALPLNDNGKLAVDRLPDAPPPVPRRQVARGSGVLARIQDAWADVLGRRVDSMDLSFFDAGGRSLDAIHLHDLIERTTQLTLDPTFVFEYSSLRRQVGELSTRLAQEQKVNGTAPPSRTGGNPL